VEANLTSLAVIGVLTTVVSFYFYLYVIVQMYMKDPNEDFADAKLTPALTAALVLAAVGTLYLGFLPARVLEWTSSAALTFLQ
jgi:NADH-quinone oxidoreductase subunit N